MTPASTGKAFWLLVVASLFRVLAIGQGCTQTVPVRVVDRDTGAAIEPLTAEMVIARMGETPVLISAPTRIRASPIIVLIDESGSMEGAKPFSRQREALRSLKQTLSTLMAQLPPGATLQFGTFT